MTFLDGIIYNLKGVALSLKTPKLLFLGILRFLVVLLFTIILSGMILIWHEQILSMIWMKPESGWIIYLWQVVSWILSLVLAAVSMVISYLIAQLFFCVFIMDLMSQITERMVLDKRAGPATGSWFGFFVYLVKQEIPRAVIPVMITFALMLIGLLTPISPIIIVASSLAAAVFLAWDNTDLTPARRQIPFKTRVGFLKKNLGFHVGFGLFFLIPWLNILFLSFAPVGATLYYLDQEKKTR